MNIARWFVVLTLMTVLVTAGPGMILHTVPVDVNNEPGADGTYFRVKATITNCTEPCTVRFEVETNDSGILMFRWDLNNDSIYDYPDQIGHPMGNWITDTDFLYTFYDDYFGDVCVQGFDGLSRYRLACTGVYIGNEIPLVMLSTITLNATATLRIAGEKWHDVSIYLIDNGNETFIGSLIRQPGKPQELSFPVITGLSVNSHLRLEYTPDDDRVNGQRNGATPAWITFSFDTKPSIMMHHTFKVRHQATWIWTVSLSLASAGSAIEFTATATDPGADNLTFEWDFGDGGPIITSVHYCLGVYPFTATDTQSHVYTTPGSYNAKLTVSDDDGGSTTTSITINVS